MKERGKGSGGKETDKGEEGREEEEEQGVKGRINVLWVRGFVS